MGLLGTTVKYGGLLVAGLEGKKAYDRHQDKKRSQQQYPAPRDTRSIEQTPYVNQSYPQQYGQQQSVQGSFHQVWCKGNCGGKCIPAETWRSLGLDPAPQYEETKPVY